MGCLAVARDLGFTGVMVLAAWIDCWSVDVGCMFDGCVSMAVVVSKMIRMSE